MIVLLLDILFFLENYAHLAKKNVENKQKLAMKKIMVVNVECIFQLISTLISIDVH